MSSDVVIGRAHDNDLPAVLRLWQEAEVTPPGPTEFAHRPDMLD